MIEKNNNYENYLSNSLGNNKYKESYNYTILLIIFPYYHYSDNGGKTI